MVCLVRWFHGGVVKENGEFENMKDVTRMFEVTPCLDVDLKTDVEWDQFKRLVEQASVPYLDVVVTSRKTAGREGGRELVPQLGTQESTISQLGIGVIQQEQMQSKGTECADDSDSETFSFDEIEPGTAHDYFPNDVFEMEEVEQDDDDISEGTDGGDDNDGMAHPRFPLLELAYDDTHRAHMIADQNMAWPFTDSMPPYAYVWKNAEAVRGPPRRRYTAYTNEIDCLTGNQNDWRVTHQDYLHMWEQRQRHHITAGEDWFPGENQHYLLWFHRVARTRLRPTAMEYNMEDVDTDAEDDYDVDTRWGNQPERAPLHDHMRVRRTCRRMALKLNCVTANPVDPARTPGGSSDSQPTGGGSLAMAGPSSSHRAGKAPASPQASDEGVPGEDSEGSPAPGFADQFIFSQHMDDAPPYTQTQGESSQMNMTQTQGESSQVRQRCVLSTRMAMHYLGDAVGVTALTFPAVPIAYRPGHVGSVGQQMSSAHQIRGRHGVESRLPVEPCVLNLTVFKYAMF
ncbi:hypothetical protein HU200_040476 [Digitaria exilis]|uniref:Aminotransferase-like plant mobile domain-containing protein n=1 Tax=Digitaria exilis TaxID=1010633 RepID=A0A835EIQ7_9POAL|nr:hypothetical protein HU200_040476 [Digitaria exilis]